MSKKKQDEKQQGSGIRLIPTETDEQRVAKELFRGLQAIADDSFPRTCPRCGKVYHSAEDFLVTETKALYNSTGLRASQDEEDHTVVEVYRNCTCGSTLVEFFGDRRDMSPAGVRRRNRFGQLLDMLMGRGIDREEARLALLSVLRGGSSPLLESLGLSSATMAEP